MLRWLYNIGVQGYYLLSRILAPFYPKARLFVNGRKARHWKKISTKAQGEKRVWIHVASLGEFEQGKPLIEKIKKLHPDVSILLTFFSPSGFEIRKDYDVADCVSYLPIDTRQNAMEIMEHVQPDLLIMVKYEFWINHIEEAFNRGIPVVYVSAIFRPQHIYFNRGRRLYRSIFNGVNRFFVQDELSRDLLEHEGITQVEVSGDTRFDRVIEISQQAIPIEIIDQFVTDAHVFVMGSVWEDDIDILGPFIHSKHTTYKFIIAPHNIDESSLNRIEKKLPQCVRYSSFATDYVRQSVLIIDNIGMLSALYKYARYTYVGGAFHGGLHNTLEASVYGIPVFFGHHDTNTKFNEVRGLKDVEGGFDFVDLKEFESIFDRLETDQTLYKRSSEAARNFTHRHAGATDKILSYISQFL